ncbi:MAG: methyltransferase domain-containing protein [Proteobacteria bacterium]|nr:methyltransferase domain-containing protein [Pseudomonadota bacterium]
MYNTHITEKQFKNLVGIVHKVSGISLNESKKSLLKARIAKRLRATRINSISDYIQLIDQDKDEFDNFIDGITTNHTYFFRENKHCEYIINTMDPSKSLKIWSAASSSGEEAYSIAIQLIENHFRFEIFASDISDTMLEIAGRGIYPLDRVRAVPKQLLHKYFQKGVNHSANKVKVKPEVKTHIRFGKYNLVTAPPPKAEYDIIFCRNVMIYFDLPTKQKVMDDMWTALKTGGYFIFGQSESIVGIKTPLKTISPSIYQKR